MSTNAKSKQDFPLPCQELKDHYQPTSIVKSRQSLSQDFERLSKEFEERTINSSTLSRDNKVIDTHRKASQPNINETEFCEEVMNTVKTLGLSSGVKHRESDSGVSSAQSTGTVPWGQEGDDSIVLWYIQGEIPGVEKYGKFSYSSSVLFWCKCSFFCKQIGTYMVLIWLKLMNLHNFPTIKTLFFYALLFFPECLLINILYPVLIWQKKQ